MPATDARAQFVRQEFRNAKPTGGANASIVAAYGNSARRTDEPIESFFETEADAVAMCDERMALLAEHNRLHKHVVTGTDTGLGLNYIGATPTATVIDDEGAVNGAALVSEIVVDFEAHTTQIETWGPA